MKIIFLFIMVFLHIVDDYYLQGILASMKQKSWWKKNAPDELYKNDYKMVLYEHAFSWSFMITIPWLIYAIAINNDRYYIPLILLYIVNTFLHGFIDDIKANIKSINLIEDQFIHFIQIILTWICLSGI